MEAAYDSLLKDLKARKFAPLYFFCGEEAFFIDELVEQIEVHTLNDMEKAFNQTVVYGKDITARQLAEICGRLPMMAERQVVIVKEAQGLSLKEEEEQQYLAYLKNPVKTTLLVFAWKHGTPDGRKAFTKEIKKAACYVESKLLNENRVAPWIKTQLQRKKITITDDAAQLMVEYTGNQLSKIANELEKLMLNKQSGEQITADDIERLIGISKEFNVFELSNAVAAGDRSRAYYIVNYFKANPKNGPLTLVLAVLYSMFMKVYQVHLTGSVSDEQAAKVLGMNSPYQIKLHRQTARLYSLPRIEHVLQLLETYDLRHKGVGNQGVEEGELLREMIYKIMNP